MNKSKILVFLFVVASMSGCKKETGQINSLDCSSYQISGPVTSGISVNGNSIVVPYSGGDGGNHSGQMVNSTGVTGMTAVLSAGSFTLGNGDLTYDLSGTPSTSGTANFELNIGGKDCIVPLTVNASSAGQCNAKVSPTETLTFMCYNLGAANTSADPFTPSWEITGGYWQWGRKNMAAPGPTANNPNTDAIGGWNITAAADGSWTDDAKTANDPCPAGFRVPTKAQWDAVLFNNALTNVGTWTTSNTNYSSGKMIGNKLFIPAAGGRYENDGALGNRGSLGYYWSSSESDSILAWGLLFGSSNVTNNYYRTSGKSVRCVAE
jgi:uncharacterized protein (TIGR02145 family)